MPKPARRRSADEDLADIGRYRQSARFSEVEKLALDLAVAMTSTPAEVSGALRDELRRHLTDGQLAELAASIAWRTTGRGSTVVWECGRRASPKAATASSPNTRDATTQLSTPTALEATMTTVTNAAVASASMRSFAHGVIGMASVGLKAVESVNARYR